MEHLGSLTLGLVGLKGVLSHCIFVGVFLGSATSLNVLAGDGAGLDLIRIIVQLINLRLIYVC